MEKTEQRPGPIVDLDARLSLDDTFRFACGPDVPCFTECCGKLDLLLTPYDVLRLRRRLRIPSARFLDDHTITRWRTSHGFPEIMMRMDKQADKKCPFVTREGCSVYEDRPGACRIYPLGRAATKNPLDGSAKEFYFTVREDHCKGFEQSRDWTVGEWIEDQGIEEYNRFNDLLMDFYLLGKSRRNIPIGPQHMQMFIMACYNTERFRAFIFESGFLKKFDLEDSLVETLKDDDTELLEFAFQWLKFALFREPVLTVRPQVAQGLGGSLKK